MSSGGDFITENEDTIGKSDLNEMNEISFSHPESVRPCNNKSTLKIYPSTNSLFQRSKSGNIGVVNKLSVETDNSSSVQGRLLMLMYRV